MLQSRIDPLEHGDVAALVCLDDPGLQEFVIDQLGQLHFGIQTANTPDEVAYRLHGRTFEVVVTSEHFANGNMEAHTILDALAKLPLAERRSAFVVMIGENLQSRSSIDAFVYSVDLTLNTIDLLDFKNVVGRGIVQQEEFYAPYKAVYKAHSQQFLG